MFINTNGFRCNNNKKIDQMIDFCKRNKVDLVILIERNLKLITKTIDFILAKIKEFGRETECFYADSKVYEITNSD